MSLNVAIIGAGNIGRKRAAVISNFSGCCLKVISDIDTNRVERLAREYGGEIETNWKRALTRSDIDVVVAATINKLLLPVSIMALKRGKHVLCEKPLGRNAKESKRIVEAINASGAILKAGFNHRHHPAISEAKRLADEGEIGNIYYIRCIYGHGGRPGYEKEWRASKDLCGGGELLDQGVHVVDLFRWFLGDFDEAYGKIQTYYWDMEVEDNAFAIFKTKEGQTAMMHTSWTQWKNKFFFEVFGEKGYLLIDGLGGSYGTEKLVIGKRKEGKEREQYLGGPPDEKIVEYPGPDISWQEEWKEFISAIKENREPMGSGYDGLMANKMIEAVYKSAKLNKPVKII